MITNFDIINKINPLATNLYYQGGNVDALYGPYAAPQEGDLYFEYKTLNGTIRVPEEGVFNTKLEYAQKLAENYLRQKGVFILGRKVLLIDDNNNPIEYTVAYNSNQQLELITSDELEIYTIQFYSLDAGGAMIAYKVYGDFFNLPESKFIAPKYMTSSGFREQIFQGWRICKPSTNSEIKFEFSDKVYSVYELIDLSEHFYFKDDIKIVDLYTEYVIPEEVTVDFEPIVYDTEIITDTTQPKENFSTYFKLEQYSNDGTPENIKPDDWDYNYKSYFVKEDYSGDCYTYQEISWDKINDSKYLGDEYKWTETNFKKYFNENQWEDSQNPVLFKDLMLKEGQEYPPQYMWEFKYDTDWNIFNSETIGFMCRKWYKAIKRPSNKMTKYKTCGYDWEEYKDKNIYSHVIVNKLSMFSNGQLYGDVLYDTFDAGLITANTGSTIQISSEMKEPYKTKYMFDHWLIEGYETINTPTPQYTHEYTTSTTTFIFDDIKHKKTSSDEYCDYYKIKAIYKKRPTYCKLFLTTNSNENNALGNTCIYGMVKNKNINKGNINIGESQINTSISIETRVKLCEITSTGEYIIMENIPGVNIETIASLWGDENTTTYFKIDTERYPTIQIVGEPVIDDKETTPNKPLFYKWTGCIENTSNTIDLSLVIGGIYELKSWFCYDGDLMSKVRVLKYTGTQDIPNDITVGVYDWKNEELTITDGKISINENIPKQYLISTQQSIFDKNQTTQTNKKYITGMTYTSVNKPNINTLPLLNLGSNRRVIDLDNQLDNNNTCVAYIDIDNVEKSNGCYIVVDIPQNSEFNFDGWNDNSTNYQIENITKDDKTYNRYIRYVEVNSTDLYTFVAILSKKIIHTNNETTTNIPTIKDMADELKTKFSGVKNTKLSDSNQNTNDIIKGKIGNSLSLGGAIYQGKQDALKNNKKVKVILSDVTEEEATETIIIDVNDDITSLDTETTEPTEVLNESPVIKEIINVTTQNVGKIEINNDTDTSNYDENFNKIVSKTTRTFNTPQMSLNLNNNIKNNI